MSWKGGLDLPAEPTKSIEIININSIGNRSGNRTIAFAAPIKDQRNVFTPLWKDINYWVFTGQLKHFRNTRFLPVREVPTYINNIKAYPKLKTALSVIQHYAAQLIEAQLFG